MIKISLIVACLALTACAATGSGPEPDTTEYTVLAPVTIVEFGGKTATKTEIAECEAAGGNVSPQGMLGGDFCVIPFSDGGQVCTDGAQCIGDCRADTALDSDETMKATSGTCQADNNPFGCYATIEGGKGTPMLCVD